jgi:HTH-type transcriptional regulator/antitoxin HigA
MAIDSHDFKTPGQLLDALIKERGWTQRVLGIVLGIDETGVNRLVTDKRQIDAEMALTLEELFHVPADRFLSLQKDFDLAKARISFAPDASRSLRAHIFGGLPVSDMIKRGWIKAKDVRDTKAVQPELMRFFRVNRIEDIEILPHAAKKTNFNMNATPSQVAWLYRVKQIAEQMLVGRYSQEGILSAISKMKSLLSAPEEARKVPKILAESGIRFVLVEALPSSKIDGVCFWLNDNSPVIALSMRFDRIDNFWFVLRHELEHVRHRHGLEKIMLDTDMEGDGNEITDDERIANNAAAEFCVPQKMMDAFIARKNPFFREADIVAFSRMIKVHPGIIAGQLRHKTGRYDRFSNHLVKVRAIVAPNAMTDGWGDVAPLGN